MAGSEEQARERNAGDLCRMVDEVLLGLNDPRPPPPDTFFGVLHRRAERTYGGIKWDAKAILEYWWWLARIGVISLVGDNLGAKDYEMDCWAVFGRPWRGFEGRKLG